MKKQTLFVAAMIIALVVVPAMAMEGHGGHGDGSMHAMPSDHPMDSGAHGMQDKDAHGMQMDHTGMGGTFKHMASGGGMDAEFQVMSLASMNMTSDKGETHHIMVNLKGSDNGTPIKDAIGKIKVIAPDKSEQISPLKNYNGILAANFTFKEPGKYGVICLLKVKDKKQVFKFWYDQME